MGTDRSFFAKELNDEMLHSIGPVPLDSGF
jgi:hypothetical protein